MRGTEDKEPGAHSVCFAPFRLDLANEQVNLGVISNDGEVREERPGYEDNRLKA